MIIGVFLISGCQEELRPKGDLNQQKSEIRFSAVEYEAVLTRSTEGNPEEKRMFLGIAGKDSLFISVSESPIASGVSTKAGTADVPESFHINAFMNDQASPYIDMKLASSDGWETYSPTLYWPHEYEKIHFFAWSYNLGNNLISPEFRTDNGYTADFDYIIPHSESSDDDAEVQPDLSFAITPSQTEDSEPVELDFVHTLAAIEFKIGKIGDAAIKSSTTKLTNILSEGHCRISHPVCVENIEWTYTGDRAEYSQTIKDGVPFMIIPQDLSNTVMLHMTVTIGNVTHVFSPKSLSGLTPKWEANKKYCYTITKGGEVKVDVDDEHTNKVKSNVTICNTGFSTTYIRAAVVGYWFTETDGIEEILSVWDINDENAGVVEWGNDWDKNWELVNGLYYYKKTVAPGENTVPLFKSYNLTSTGPASGSRLNITLAVQSVEAAKAAEVWPDLPSVISAN